MNGGTGPAAAFTFRGGFLWGAATAAHQVEGGNTNNDWWEWERTPGNTRDGTVSGAACEHYERFREDFAMLADMGHNAHRLSLEWSRIEPRPGFIDGDAVRHYREVLESLVSLGMRPMVTLHHFTNPLWFARAGGWTEPFSVDAFRAFARLCAREYGDIVDSWCTFNEPNVYAYQSYANGYWPPQLRDSGAAAVVLRNMLRAHAAGYREIKGAPHGQRAQVGIAQHLRVFEAWRPWNPLDRAAATLPDLAFNQWFLRGCMTGAAGFPLGRFEKVPEAAGTLDYVGVNYYSRDMIGFDHRNSAQLFSRTFTRPGAELTEYQMELFPEGLYKVLMQAHRLCGLPIYITENGVADAGDRMRARAIVGHLAEAARAVRDGVDLRGYLHWSAMDNFEWAEGYSMRFGLVRVDFETQAREPRPSAAVLSAIISRNGLSWDELREYYPQGLRYFVSAVA